jgi:23S rRNA (uracil747-C5)-methyltransferase
VSANIQPKPAAVLEGPDEILLTEEKFIWEEYGGVRVAFQPQCFIQVTPETASALYRHAAAWAAKTNAKRVLDLFCGAGGFMLACAKSIREGLGFELSQTAIESARLSALENGVQNLSFVSGDVELKQRAWTEFAPDLLITNPARPLSLRHRSDFGLSAGAYSLLQLQSGNPAARYWRAAGRLSGHRAGPV